MNKRFIAYAILGLFGFVAIGVSYYFWNLYPAPKKISSSTNPPAEVQNEPTSKEEVPLREKPWLGTQTSTDGSLTVYFYPDFESTESRGGRGCEYEIFLNGSETSLVLDEHREKIGEVASCYPSEAGRSPNSTFYGWSEDNRLFIKPAKNRSSVQIYDPVTGTVETFALEVFKDSSIVDVDKTGEYFFAGGLILTKEEEVIFDTKTFLPEIESDIRAFGIRYDEMNHGFVFGKSWYEDGLNISDRLYFAEYAFFSLEDFTLQTILTTPDGYPKWIGRGCGSFGRESIRSLQEPGTILLSNCGTGIPGQLFTDGAYILVPVS